MSLIDERGRLFGRVNLIDAFVGLVVFGLIPLAYGAFLMFRPPIPTITAVSPDHLTSASTVSRPRLQVTGENFREALLVRFGTVPSPGFLVQNSRSGEVLVPVLSEGTYDLLLFDGPHLLQTVPAAFKIVDTPPPAPAVAPVRRAEALVTIRFATEPEVLGAMNVGDRDVAATEEEPLAPGAVLTGIGTERLTMNASTTVEGVLGRSGLSVQRQVVVFTGTARVPVAYSSAGWTYRGRFIKIGAPFAFVTMSAAMGGVILDVKIRPER